MDLLANYPEIIEEMNIIEDKLTLSVKSRQKIVAQATQELLEAGGKRLRPLLLLLSANLGEYNSDKITSLAASIELLHMATLVHDDIIDDSVLRRGNQTVQSRWGKDVAVFTGDYLLCKALLLIPQDINTKNSKRIVRAIKVVCEGEIQQYQDKYNQNISVQGYLKRIAAKTASLFSMSCYIGASEAKFDKKIVNAFAKFGMSLGMAFQITDDILDIVGKSKTMGKPMGIDFTQGIYTLPIIYALQNKHYSMVIEEILLKQYEREDTPDIFEQILKSGGIENSKKLANRYIERAKRYLNELPNGLSKEIMHQLLEQLVSRTS